MRKCFLGKKCWYKVLYSAYLLNEMWLAGTMDLNKPPPEFDYDFLDGVDSNPSYCTQATPAVASLQVQNHQADQDVGGTLIADVNTKMLTVLLSIPKKLLVMVFLRKL